MSASASGSALASVAVDPSADDDLVALDASHLFAGQTSWIGFRRGSVLRTYSYDFIELLAPHLTRKRVRKAEPMKSNEALNPAVGALETPVKRR
jgi:LysR family cys regulon transcriptional activator